MSIKIDRLTFADFYDLQKQQKRVGKRKCMKCGASIMDKHICPHCSRINGRQARMVQESKTP